MQTTTQQTLKRAESPAVNSVGQRPTKRKQYAKSRRSVIKMSPFQGLKWLDDLLFHRAMPYANDFGLSAHRSPYPICNAK